MTTTRCNAAERAAFRNRVGSSGHHRTEPALGTLDQRLSIVIQRLGGSIGLPKPTQRERKDYADWLTDNNLVNVSDHWSAVPLPLEEVA